MPEYVYITVILRSQTLNFHFLPARYPFCRILLVVQRQYQHDRYDN